MNYRSQLNWVRLQRLLMSLCFTSSLINPSISMASEVEAYAQTKFIKTEAEAKACNGAKTTLVGTECNDKTSPQILQGTKLMSDRRANQDILGAIPENANVAQADGAAATASVEGAKETCNASMFRCGEVCEKAEKQAKEDLNACIEGAPAEAEKKCKGNSAAEKECAQIRKISYERKCKELEDLHVKKIRGDLNSCKFNRTAFVGLAAGLLGALGMAMLSNKKTEQATSYGQNGANGNGSGNSGSNGNNSGARTASCRNNDMTCICNSGQSDPRCACFNSGTGYLDQQCMSQNNISSNGSGDGQLNYKGDNKTKYEDAKDKLKAGELEATASTSSGSSAGRTSSGSTSSTGEFDGKSGVSSGGSSEVAASLNDLDAAAEKFSETASSSASDTVGSSGSSELAQYLPGQAQDPSRDIANASSLATDRAQVAPKTSNIWANISRAYKKASLAAE